MNPKEQLIDICEKELQQRFSDDKDYKQRFSLELKEIDLQDTYQYFIDIYNKKEIYENEYNLLTPYLLGICKEFDIAKESSFVFGEMPDIDTDMISPIRDYLKNEWAQKRFGQEYVAHIGTYNSYRLSSAILDMCKVFDIDRNEALKITKQFGLKDDDGNDLTWDAALAMYPAFKEFTEKYPEMAEAAKKITGKYKSIGKHAGGLIVSNTPINEFVPLMGKDYEITTAWPEGQASQDLSAVGLVKCDLLVISFLSLLSKATERIKRRHGIDFICSLPGSKADWSDTSYLNDPKALAMANAGDLKMVFQFDSDGIRALAKKGGVTSFDDLVAYTALYRPATLEMGMHDAYCNRKSGKEKYEIHPAIEPITKNTFNVILYQEQCLKILNVVGNIPLRDCEIIRKAISKKKVEYFLKYKEIFIQNGQNNLGMSEKDVTRIWEEIEAFALYSFNLAHAASYTYLTARCLYLKSHYPLEYIADSLNHVNESQNDRDIKLRDYITDARKHNVKVLPLDLNKSKEEFDIVEDKIYTGFSCIKGIGENVAKEIVRKQPYTGFQDFLERFGTDISVLKPLIALRTFGNANPEDLFAYLDYYKDAINKEKSAATRYEVSIKKHHDKLKELCGLTEFNDTLPAEAQKLYKAYLRTINNRKDKKAEKIYSFDEYKAKSDIDPKLKELCDNIELAEKQYYGFCWTHPLDKCKETKGFTFENYRLNNFSVGPVEGLVVEAKKFPKYVLVNLQDQNWETSGITIWLDDYEKFKNLLQSGMIVRMRLTPPTKGFSRYTLFSVPKWQKNKIKDIEYKVVALN